VEKEKVNEGKLILEQMVRQLVGLMKSHGLNYHDDITGNRLREDNEAWDEGRVERGDGV
jgi:hypothetical protein